MKELFRTRSYEMVRMFLNQFATSIFGLVLAIAAQKSENATLRNITSVGAILFYLFLLYTMTWEIGFADRTAVEAGRKPKRPFTGVLLSVFANFINWLLAICILLGHLLDDVTFFTRLRDIARMGAQFLEGMFTGLLANRVGGVSLNSVWWIYFLLPIPSILTCGIAYLLGLHDVKHTGFFTVQYPDSDRDPKRRRRR